MSFSLESWLKQLMLATMQIIPSNMLPERDKGALRAFLEGCRETAREKNHFQIASISLAVKHIAPLAVLESIYEPEALHFYVERSADEEALAGAEAVVEARFSGVERFAKAQAFANEILENTIAVGDLDAPFTGPHFFTAFTFDDEVAENSAFAPATIFLPRWQVSCSQGKYGAVANVRIEADADIDQLVARVWGAYQKFSSFDYPGGTATTLQPVKPKVVEQAELSTKIYAEAVTEALGEIHSGAYEKIVLARGIKLVADAPWEPLSTLNSLHERFARCFTFSFGGGDGRSFIGATPERLLRVRDGQLLTEAIAGSAPRGATAGEDAKFARDLLRSEKDLREHTCVRDSILRRLDRIGISGSTTTVPQLLQLANVQHLQSVIKAEVDKKVHLLEIVQNMHPTPAVGGTPREKAVPRIHDLEQIDRGLYSGVIGWFNHLNEGEMVVGLRSALVEGREARLYAGAGIVNGSVPEKEMQETELKLNALLNVLVS
ncbi:MAG: menaquinone-specific isochorismate synthase [Lentimonas sp.]|jgi:menaquinone-specific isochorismate synthase